MTAGLGGPHHRQLAMPLGASLSAARSARLTSSVGDGSPQIRLSRGSVGGPGAGRERAVRLGP